jgi:hypothetical protein
MLDIKITGYDHGTILSLCKSCIASVKKLSDNVYNFVKSTYYNLQFNSQKILMQRYLNDQFDNSLRRIWIRINQRNKINYRASEWSSVFKPNYVFRWEEILGATYGEQVYDLDFTSLVEIGTVAIFTHNLNTSYPIVSIKDNNGYILAPSNYVLTIVDNNRVQVDFLRVIPGTFHIRVVNDLFLVQPTIQGVLIYKYRATEQVDYSINSFDVMVPTGVTFDLVKLNTGIQQYAFPWLKYSIITY